MELKEGRYHIGGVPVEDIVKLAGTPVYVHDTAVMARQLGRLRDGDLLAFRNAGAYGWSMASNYNSRFRPPEVLVHNGRAQLVRRRETLEDLLRTQVEVVLD